MFSFSTFLNEEVYGFKAVVYHRTSNPLDIFNKGYRQGDGVMYGDGLYCCFDIYSQLNDEMVAKYGDYLLKVAVNLQGFLILDRDIQYKLFGKPMPILQQMAKIGIVPKSRSLSPANKKDLIGMIYYNYGEVDLEWCKKIEEIINKAKYVDELFFGQDYKLNREVHDLFKDYLDKIQYDINITDLSKFAKYERMLDQGTTSSIIALKLVEQARNFDGMMFTGQQDGRVCVVYSVKKAKFLGYANVRKSTEPESIRWIPLEKKSISQFE